MNSVLYFAYGSNMMQQNLENRVGKVKKIGVNFIDGFELKFNYGNEKESFANIVINDNSKVIGVIYKLTFDQLQLLDYYEGYGYPQYYSRIVESIDNKPVQVYISFNIRFEFEKPVNKKYLNKIKKGYKENNIEFNLKTK